MSDQGELYVDSWILYYVLDRLMGSKELVAVRKRLSLVEEEINNYKRTDCHWFSPGSSAEGVQIRGSDVDYMVISKEVVVLSPDQDANVTPNSKTVFVMRDANCRPGYVTLELNWRLGCSIYPSTALVRVGDLYFISSELYTQFSVDEIKKFLHLNTTPHGPAVSFLDEQCNLGPDIDVVPGFSYSSWPKEANEWVSRPRLHNWPDKCLRYQIVQGGCHLVPVGDKTSTDSFLQWRISFVTAERKLIHSLNHVQFLVYCLLKYLLKQISDRLKTIYGDTDILSSYIIKTCLFYAVENTPRSLWQEKNTFLCFMLCLNILTTWVKAGYCPNYFIYRNNMFLGKVHGDNQQKLLRFLVQLHDMTWGCLSIGTFFKSSIGELIHSVKNGASELGPPTPARSERECDLKIFSKTFAIICGDHVLPIGLELLFKSKSDVDDFIGYLITLRALSCRGMETFEKHVHPIGNKEKYKSLRGCKTFITPLASVCTSPGLLTLATYHYQTGNYRKTLKMCERLISSWEGFVDVACSVNDEDKYEQLYCGRGYTLLHKCQQGCIASFNFTKSYSQFCPSQLRQENLYSSSALDIPPLPYAVFMTFLCYHELGDTRRRDAALVHLVTVKYDEYRGGSQYWIVHNLLGICYEMVGDIRRAVGEYKESLGSKSGRQYLNTAKQSLKRLEQLI